MGEAGNVKGSSAARHDEFVVIGDRVVVQWVVGGRWGVSLGVVVGVWCYAVEDERKRRKRLQQQKFTQADGGLASLSGNEARACSWKGRLRIAEQGE